ncbi:MAG: hypothetical protein U9R14_03385, partial [Patescibacteria group bacterium]|nr:hypothetical protein [Patescibacteria group bacterium]
MRKFFKKNKNIVWPSLTLLLGIILGLFVSYFWLSKTDFWEQKRLTSTSARGENVDAQNLSKEAEQI